MSAAAQPIQGGTALRAVRDPIAGRAFTLIELVLVMVLIAVMAALSVPALARSMRSRGLASEGDRLLALTEYARDEARSQGVPMTVWIDGPGGRYGVEPKEGFSGSADRNRTFTLAPEIQFARLDAPTSGGSVRAAEFEPDGTMDPASLDRIRLNDKAGNAVELARTADRWGYEVAKGAPK